MITAITRKGFKGDETNYQMKTLVDMVVPGLEGVRSVPMTTNGKKQTVRFLNPRDLRCNKLIVVEGENDLLAVHESIHCCGSEFAGWGVVGTGGGPSDKQLGILGRCRRGKDTYISYDRDGAGERYTMKMTEHLIDAKIDARRIFILDWRRYDDAKNNKGKYLTGDVDDILSAAGAGDDRANMFQSMIDDCIVLLKWLKAMNERD